MIAAFYFQNHIFQLKTHSTAEEFFQVIHALDKGICNKENKAQILTLGAVFPSEVTPVFGLECTITDDRSSSDLLTYHNADHNAKLFLSRESDYVFSRSVSGAVWNRIFNFTHAWRTDPLMAAGIDDIWLEFDLRETGTQKKHDPSFFFGPKLYMYESLFSPGDRVLKLYLTRIILRGLCELTDMTPAEQYFLSYCIECLPPCGRVFQVGKMLSRADSGIRLCIDNLSTEQIQEYLSQITDRDDIMQIVNKWLFKIESSVWKIRMSLDITDRLLPKIGLECYFRPDPSRQSSRQGIEFLSLLSENNLCTNKKRRIASALFAGQSGDTYDGKETIPMNGISVGAEQEGNHISVSHLKLTLVPDYTPTAKMYVAVRSSVRN